MIPIKKYWFVILFSLTLVSCQETETKGKEEPIEQEKPKDQLWSGTLNSFIQNYDLCIVITNNGCKGCNEGLVEVAEKYLKSGEKRFGVVVETTGAAYDISPLLKDEYQDRISHDYRAQLTNYYEAENSFLLFYRDGMEKSEAQRFEVTLKNMHELEPKLKEFLAQASKNPQ